MAFKMKYGKHGDLPFKKSGTPPPKPTDYETKKEYQTAKQDYLSKLKKNNNG